MYICTPMQRTRDFPENGNFQKLEKIKSHNMTYTKQQKSELTREINAQKKYVSNMLRCNDMDKTGTVSYTHLTLPTNREV